MSFDFAFHILPLVGCYLQVYAGRLQSDSSLSPYRNLEHAIARAIFLHTQKLNLTLTTASSQSKSSDSENSQQITKRKQETSSGWRTFERDM
jgi:hypothetical protein